MFRGNTPLHTGADDLDWIELDGLQRATVDLNLGYTAWNPASMKRVIYGPARVTYERFPSGQIVATVEDPS